METFKFAQAISGCGQALFKLLSTGSLWCVLQTLGVVVVFVLHLVVVLWLII